MGEVPQRLIEALHDVYDPCCREKGISVVDMGLIRSAWIEEGHARVELLLTSGWCPFAARVLTDVRERVEAIAGIDSAEVEVVWDEAWSTDRLSPSAARMLRFLPDPGTVADRDGYVAAHLPRPGSAGHPTSAGPPGSPERPSRPESTPLPPPAASKGGRP
jgi:metal-sulfur cluster biosynthetic enzyme